MFLQDLLTEDGLCPAHTNKMLIKMAEKQKLRAPSTIAGLVRYDEEDKESLIKLKPVHVIEIALALIVIELILFLIF